MPKTRQQKEQVLKRLNDQLSDIKGGVLVAFDGLEVNQDQKLRSDLRKHTPQITIGPITGPFCM